MKRLLAILIAACGWFMLESCADCDETIPTQTTVIGNYRMTHWNVPEPIDFDQDGDFSVNLLEESNCFLDTRLLFHANGTFTKTYNSVNIVNGTASCQTENFSGSWSQSGSEIALVFGHDGHTEIYHFDTAEKTLLKSVENGTFPNMENGIAYYDTGNVQMIFGAGF